jgi:hypothetical protein
MFLLRKCMWRHSTNTNFVIDFEVSTNVGYTPMRHISFNEEDLLTLKLPSLNDEEDLLSKNYLT